MYSVSQLTFSSWVDAVPFSSASSLSFTLGSHTGIETWCKCKSKTLKQQPFAAIAGAARLRRSEKHVSRKASWETSSSPEVGCNYNACEREPVKIITKQY